MRIAILFTIVFLAVSPASAKERLRLEGTMTQGALIVGTTEPGTRIKVAGKEIRVTDKGYFVFGFGRDAAGNIELVARYRDGRQEVRKLTLGKRKYKVSRIDGLPKAKVSPGKADLVRIRKESKMIRTARLRDSARSDYRGGFVWPVHGRISGVYGSRRVLNGAPRRPHFGVDVAAPKGTPVNAMAAGVITLAHGDMFFTGKTIMIDHGQGVASIYAHLSAIDVKSGQRVAKGQQIGRIGATGRVTGPHLHYGLTLFGLQLDPALLTGPMPKTKRR